MKKVDTRKTVGGRTVRFTNFVDSESLAFEREAAEFFSDSANEQSVEYLRHSSRSFFLLQIRAVDGKPAAQACVYLGRARGLPSFAMASVPNFGRSRNGEEEAFGIEMLRELCRKIPGVMTLRLQPKRFDPEELADFQGRALRAGFRASPPLGVTRTTQLELRASAEELMASLPRKTRAQIRHPRRSRVELRVLTEAEFIEDCRKAANCSRHRTGSGDSPFDFEATFALARNCPSRARVIGLFMADRLKAYIIGLRNGNWCEFVSAGAFTDPELRAVPFNYFLLWELAQWAREMGSSRMDMGGITDGGPEDPLRGISQFKRAIADQELEVGREMILVLRPLRFLVYRSLKNMLTAAKSMKAMKSWFRPIPSEMVPSYD